MREHVHGAGVDGEQGIELVGDTDAFGFDAQEKRPRITVVGVVRATDDRQTRQAVCVQRPTDFTSSGDADAFDQHPLAERGNAPDFDEFVWFEAGDDVASLGERRIHSTSAHVRRNGGPRPLQCFSAFNNPVRQCRRSLPLAKLGAQKFGHRNWAKRRLYFHAVLCLRYNGLARLPNSWILSP